ncbi:MAG TPA: metallophosphoesterase [Gemmataceae bacterium]|nr:metallophosphoesterase [Gemmataceae bacterium]
MKRMICAVMAGAALVAAVAFSQPAASTGNAPAGAIQVHAEERNPWTHLRLNNDREEFQFAIVSDRTGGHREKIFSRAVEQLNLLQPEFVLSVGDLIEGYSTDREKVLEQWREFQTYTAKLQMPFFYVPGNHDVTNLDQEKIWEQKFGRRYYHFMYNGVLFLILNSDDPPASASLSETQVKWAKQVLADNADARWTIVAFHKPIWTGDIEKNRWGEVERALAGRNFTVFVGHVHRYQKFVRNGMNYYQLATTGGGSRLRGVRYGEFDHIVWVTMKKTGPVLANVMLDGILPENLTVPDTQEPVKEFDRKPTHPVRGWLFVDGAAAGGATVSFYLPPGDGKKAPRFVGDAIAEGDGSFVMSTYGAFDGVPVGEYLVTVAFDGRYGQPKDRKDWVPAVYTKAETTPLRVNVKGGKNEVSLELRSDRR